MVNWSIEAISVIDSRTFNSYPLRSKRNYLIPNCETPIVESNKANSFSVIGEKNTRVKVYPNPLQSILNIEFNGTTSSIKMIHIVSVNGKALITQYTSGNNAEIDVRQLNRGTYFIKISDADRGPYSMVRSLKTSQLLWT
jgi:hypothetical protein